MWIKLATAQWREQWGLVLAQVLCVALVTLFAWGAGLAPAMLDAKIRQDAGRVDLLVAAPTSPLQALLALLYHVDLPVGAIPASTLDTWSKHPQVEHAVAIAVGDNVQGHRIVGVGSTDGQFATAAKQMVDFYRNDPAAPMLRNGQLTVAHDGLANQALLGAAVADTLGLRVGQTFYAQHGLQNGGVTHPDAGYTVQGILNPTHTVLDQLVLVPIQSVWLLHEGTPSDAAEQKLLVDAREVSAVLLRFRSPIAIATLPKTIRNTGLTAASPALESQRLQPLLDALEAGARKVTALIAAGSLFALVLAMQLGLQARQHMVQTLHVLGASNLRTTSVLALEYAGIYTLGTLLAGLVLYFMLHTIVFPKGWPWAGDTLLLTAFSATVFGVMALTLAGVMMLQGQRTARHRG